MSDLSYVLMSLFIILPLLGKGTQILPNTNSTAKSIYDAEKKTLGHTSHRRGRGIFIPSDQKLNKPSSLKSFHKTQPKNYQEEEKDNYLKLQSRLYENSKKALYREFNRKIDVLNGSGVEKKQLVEQIGKELNLNNINGKEAIFNLKKQLRVVEKDLPKFADDLSKIDLEFASEIYIQAFNLYKIGKINEALRVIEANHLRDQIKKHLDGIADNEKFYPESKKTIRQLIDAYELKVKCHTLLFEYRKATHGLQIVILLLERIDPIDNLQLADAYRNIADKFRILNVKDKSLAFSKKDVAIRELLLDVNCIDLAESYRRLAVSHKAYGNYEEALAIQKKGIKIFSGQEEGNPLLELQSYTNLASIYQELEEYQDALMAQLEACERERVLNKKDIAVIIYGYTNLGLIYKELGQYQKGFRAQQNAFKMLEEFNANIKSKIEQDIAFNLFVYENFIDALINIEKYDEALVYQKQVLKTCKESFGGNHRNVANAYHKLATIYTFQQNYQKALYYQQEAIITSEMLYNYDHPSTAIYYSSLAELYNQTQNYLAALNTWEKVIEIQERIYHVNHPNLATSYNNLSLIYQKKGRYSDAWATQKKAIAIIEEIYESTHLKRATSYHNLASILFNLKQFSDAIEMEEKAIRILELKYPLGHKSLYNAQIALTIFQRQKELLNNNTDSYTNRLDPVFLSEKNTYNAPVLSELSSARKAKFIAQMLGWLSTKRVKKFFKRYHRENESIRRLEEVIALVDKSERLEEKILRQTPISYYLASAVIFEAKGDTASAMKEYCTACAVDSLTKRTTKEIDVIEKIIKLDKYYSLLKINQGQSYTTWLKQKCQIYKESFGTKINDTNDDIEDILSEIDALDQEIKKDQVEIGQAGLEIDSLNIRKAEVDIQRLSNVEVVTDLREDQNYVTMRIDGIKAEMRRGNIVDDFHEEMVGNSTVRVNVSKGEPNNNLELGSTQYNLGEFCTEQMQSSTRILVSSLLAELRDIPVDSIDQVKIRAQLTGNADWRGGRQPKLNIFFQAPRTIMENYFNIDGTKMNFRVKLNEKINLTNEELAFMRCYCVKETIDGVLDGFQIPMNNRNYTYQAFVHEDDGSDGAALRGVDIAMEVENLYKHHLDEIKNIDQRISILESRQRTLDTGIERKLAEIEDLREQIKKKEVYRDELKRKLKDVGTDNSSTSIMKRVDKVKKYRNR